MSQVQKEKKKKEKREHHGSNVTIIPPVHVHYRKVRLLSHGFSIRASYPFDPLPAGGEGWPSSVHRFDKKFSTGRTRPAVAFILNFPTLKTGLSETCSRSPRVRAFPGDDGVIRQEGRGGGRCGIRCTRCRMLSLRLRIVSATRTDRVIERCPVESYSTNNAGVFLDLEDTTSLTRKCGASSKRFRTSGIFACSKQKLEGRYDSHFVKRGKSVVFNIEMKII